MDRNYDRVGPLLRNLPQLGVASFLSNHVKTGSGKGSHYLSP